MSLALKVLLGLPIKTMMKVREEGEQNFLVYPYTNGREKGFCIVDNRTPYDLNNNYEPLDEQKAIVFSENRSSDGLVYFVGKAKNFNIWDNGHDCKCKTEAFWEDNRKLIETNQVEEGIKMIKKEFGLEKYGSKENSYNHKRGIKRNAIKKKALNYIKKGIEKDEAWRKARRDVLQ